MLKKYIIFAVLAVFLVGCAGQQQITIKPLSLAYAVPEQSESKSDVKTALVKPKYSNLTTAGKQISSTAASNPLAALMNQKLEERMPASYKLNKKYSEEYAVSFENSMSTSLEGILQSKGLKVMATADSADNIAYSQKKELDLILETSFDIAPVITVTKQLDCGRFGCSPEEGTINLGGKVYLNFIEPMSKEKMIIKTIDLSSLSNSGSLQSMNYVGTNNAQNVLVDIIGGVYPVLMAKIANVIDKEEILATVDDIKHLKEKQ